jgi:acyl-coenzyme A synthetase/AMP-(fatty) acid ligase
MTRRQRTDVIVEELPRDLNGKVVKRLLRESSTQPG